MAADTIKEFLVALGFKIDEAALKKFVEKIEGATKEVTKFATTMTATATAVGSAVIDIADHLEDLYWSAQRIGASVGNLKSFQYAATQAGVSAEAMTSTLEGLARSMRESPGLMGLFTSLTGQDPRKHDQTQNMMSLVSRLKQMPFFLAQQYASQFSIDSDTLFMLEKNMPDFVRHQKDLARYAGEAGVNLDQSAGAGHRLMTNLRQIGLQLDVLKAAGATKLMPLGEWLTDMAQRALDFALNLHKATGGWSTVVATIVGSAEGIALVGNILFKVLGIGLRLPAFGSLLMWLARLVFPTLGVALGALTAPMWAFIAVAGALAFAGYEIYKHWDKVGPSIKKAIDSFKQHVVHANVSPMVPSGAPKGAGVLQRVMQNINNNLRGIPASDAWAAAVASEKKYGIPAQVTYAQWALESGRGRHMPAGSNNPFGIKARAGEDYVWASTLESIHGHMVRVMAKFRKFASLADAFDAHDQLLARGKRYAAARLHEDDPFAFANALTGVYATDPNYGDKLGAIMRGSPLGGGSSHHTRVVTLHHKSDIHVHGDTNPARTAELVRRQQQDHIAGIVRNLQGALA